MAQLRSSYFCGTTGALSEYEALPDDLRADDEPSPQVVLCSRCHTKLANVLTPIVERLESDDVQTVPPEVAPATSSPDEHAPSPGSSAQPEVTFSSSLPDRGSTVDTDSPEGRADEAAGASDHASADATAADQLDSDEEPTGASSERGEESTVADGDGIADESKTEDGAATPEHLERVYHKLLRFLRNREFPIPRVEAETVAQSAYDLSSREATQVIQRAIDRGVLDERDGELHRS
jgi:hypothetical protein